MNREKDTLAVLFADVGRTTRPQSSMGDTTAFSQVRGCMKVLLEAAGRHRGRVVKTIGECAMFAFDTADDAAGAAMDMQDRIALMPAPDAHDRPTLRIGFHYGPVLCEGNDVFGDTVNTAARMSDLATPGQILIAAETVASLSPEMQDKARRLDALAVKGKAQAIDIQELQWQDSDSATLVPGRSGSFAQMAEPRLRLICQGREFEYRMTMKIGRAHV